MRYDWRSPAEMRQTADAGGMLAFDSPSSQSACWSVSAAAYGVCGSAHSDDDLPDDDELPPLEPLEEDGTRGA